MPPVAQQQPTPSPPPHARLSCRSIDSLDRYQIRAGTISNSSSRLPSAPTTEDKSPIPCLEVIARWLPTATGIIEINNDAAGKEKMLAWQKSIATNNTRRDTSSERRCPPPSAWPPQMNWNGSGKEINMGGFDGKVLNQTTEKNSERIQHAGAERNRNAKATGGWSKFGVTGLTVGREDLGH